MVRVLLMSRAGMVQLMIWPLTSGLMLELMNLSIGEPICRIKKVESIADQDALANLTDGYCCIRYRHDYY